jgi:hypothetical protein
MTGDKDDGDLDARVSQLALKVETVDSRKADVQNQAIWPILSLVTQKLLRRSESL